MRKIGLQKGKPGEGICHVLCEEGPDHRVQHRATPLTLLVSAIPQDGPAN